MSAVGERDGRETKFEGPERATIARRGLGADRRALREASARLSSERVERVRREAFSWLRRKLVVEARNDLVARLHDPVPEERARWIAAQRALEGREWPELVVRRYGRFGLGEFTMLLLGDPGEGDRSQEAVARAIPTAEDASDFMVLLSDVVYPSGDVNQYVEKFYEPYAAYPHTIYGVPGNHDWYDGLDGFMFHFCGAEPLPAVAYRAGSYPLREWVSRLLWRKASRPDRARLLPHRDARMPWKIGYPTQPAPYFVIETDHLALVAIDTGIKGTIDREQGEWLLRVSESIHKPKVLLTGKPLYVNGELRPCEIEWGEERRPRYVADVVRDPEFDYVAAIGGDVHNYQRYSFPADPAAGERGAPERRRGSGRETIHYLVAGGAGAFMSETHTIRRADAVDSPAGRGTIDEDDLVLYPTRGHSLALFTRQWVRWAPRFTAAALVRAIGVALIAYFFLWKGNGDWKLWQTGVAIAAAGATAALVSLFSSPERAWHRLRRGAGVAVLGAAIAALDWLHHLGVPRAAVTCALALALAVVPLAVVAFEGHLPQNGALQGLAVLFALLVWLLDPRPLELVVAYAAVAIAALVVMAVAAGLAEHARAARAARRGGTAWGGGLSALAALAPVLGALCFCFFEFGYARTLAPPLALAAALPVLYLIWIGVPQTAALALSGRFRAKLADRALVDHASKFCGERLGVAPLALPARELRIVDPQLARVFERVFPRSRLKARLPLHRWLAEIFDSDDPPFAKHFLELTVARSDGGRVLRIRAHGVDGVHPEPRVVDELPLIPLRGGPAPLPHPRRIEDFLGDAESV